MTRITIETSNVAYAKLLAAFLKSVSMIKSVSIESDDSVGIVNEPAEKYNWLNPSRLATDAEIDQMIEDCEKSESLTLAEAKAKTRTEIKAWRKRK